MRDEFSKGTRQETLYDLFKIGMLNVTDYFLEFFLMKKRNYSFNQDMDIYSSGILNNL